MRILYITRNFNRSGYMCLEKLIKGGKDIIGVVLRAEKNSLSNRFMRPFSILWYKLMCKYYGAEDDKWLYSEEILAKKNKIKVYKIRDIRSPDFIKRCQSLKPSIIVTGGGWHQRIPPEILSIPNYGCVNIHPSLLPRYRGTSVHIWQILRGESHSGVTIHYMNEDFDTGDIIAQEPVDISLRNKPHQFFHRAAVLSRSLLIETLERIETNNVVGHPQKEEDIEYFHKWKWTKENLLIDWNKSSFEIYNLIRVCSRFDYRLMGAFTYFRSGILKIWEAELLDNSPEKYKKTSPGTIIDTIRDKGVIVATGNGAILIKKVQESKWWARSIWADKYFHKRKIPVREKLG